MKIDLHCHSKYSKRPTLWLMQKLGCPESFTEPVELYALLRERGMDAVTITDHNVIDGALELAGLENTFLGCEYTTYFPKDRCKVHVLAYGFTEAQHVEMTKARENIFDLTDYFIANGIRHSCAHPFFWVNDKLTIEHVEQLVLLYKNWEINGDLCKDMNDSVVALLHGLTEADIERMADNHGVTPRAARIWEKNLTGGSDDHSSLNLGRTYTEVPNATELNEFWAGVHAGRARVRGREATPQTLARNYYGIAYQFYRSKLRLERSINKDVTLRFMDKSLKAHLETTEPLLDRLHLRLAERRTTRAAIPGAGTLLEIARIEAEKRIKDDARLLAIMRNGRDSASDMDATWFDLVQYLGDKLVLNVGSKLLDCAMNARLFDIFNSLGSTGALYLLLAPYFISYGLFARERKWSRDVVSALLPGREVAQQQRATPRVAHFTDTFYEVNGVARTINQQLAFGHELGLNYNVLICSREKSAEPRGLHVFAPAGSYRLPEYEELELLMPPLLRMLHHCYEEQYTHIHIATPGAVGLAGLAIARILNIPVSATYHTSFPQYAKAFTEDGYVEDMVWHYMVWFYEQMDSVYVPSHSTGNELIGRGISASKVKVYPRGIDVERFHPEKRDRSVIHGMGISPDATVILYVGRVSKEKNLDLLCRTFRALAAGRDDIHLVVTGDGPYRATMEEALAGLPVTFTGYKEGEDLARLYASADVLVMPSETETFGNVVLEAQAAGIPVVVSNKGATAENVIDGETGIVFTENDVESLVRALRPLLDNAGKREAMGRAARAYMETRGFRRAFESLWKMYAAEDVKQPVPHDVSAFVIESLNKLAAKAS